VDNLIRNKSLAILEASGRILDIHCARSSIFANMKENITG
jgi:predicted house-cleaning noncanonical NTP pyrophosphatase (MazG superfamily)